MKPLGLSQYRLAKDIGVEPIRISQIIKRQRSITIDTALVIPPHLEIDGRKIANFSPP